MSDLFWLSDHQIARIRQYSPWLTRHLVWIIIVTLKAFPGPVHLKAQPTAFQTKDIPRHIPCPASKRSADVRDCTKDDLNRSLTMHYRLNGSRS